MFSYRHAAGVFSLLLICACSGTSGALRGSDSLPATVVNAQSTREISASPTTTLSLPEPYMPDADAEPAVARAALARPLTATERAAEAIFSAELSDPNREVYHHRLSTDTHRSTQNVVVGGDGESIGLHTSDTFTAAGSVATLGVQLNYFVANGGNFFHTHQLVNNQCFEYGINYSAQAPTLFAYNWCTGGNTPQGWINMGLVGDPGGVLNTWNSTGNGALLSWDSYNRLYRLQLEEVRRKDGWHLLGYNWTSGKYMDLLNGHGVTGTKGACCGWAVFESHITAGTSCNFSNIFPAGQELLYDTGMKALVGKTWRSLDKISGGGFNYSTEIDCANISGQTDSTYVSPSFSGGFLDPSVAAKAPAHAGDWWMKQT